MRIAVIGAGGVGGYFGGLLAAAGNDVTFVARGRHLEAIQQNGLSLTGPRGDVVVAGARAVAGDAATDPADLVLLAVKLYDTEAAAQVARRLLAPGAAVLTLQNGVDGHQRVASVVGADRVLAGAAYVSARIDAPGTIAYTSDMSSLAFGELDGTVSPRVSAFARLCQAAGVEAKVSSDILGTLWTKFLLLATNACLTSLSRQYVARVYADPDLRAVARAAMAEIASLAAAKGIVLAADAMDRACALSDGYPPDMTTSMHHDLIAGRRLELDSFAGYVVAEAARHGIATPVNQVFWAGLKPYAEGRA